MPPRCMVIFNALQYYDYFSMVKHETTKIQKVMRFLKFIRNHTEGQKKPRILQKNVLTVFSGHHIVKSQKIYATRS